MALVAQGTAALPPLPAACELSAPCQAAPGSRIHLIFAGPQLLLLDPQPWTSGDDILVDQDYHHITTCGRPSHAAVIHRSGLWERRASLPASREAVGGLAGAPTPLLSVTLSGRYLPERRF